MKDFKQRAEELGLQLYQPCEEHDSIFLVWWRDLISSGEFERVFTHRQRALSKFTQIFQPPTLCVFAQDKNDRIWLAAWFDLFSDTEAGVFMHFWSREDMRHTRHGIAATHAIYDFATQAWPVIVGVTKHEDLLRIHRKVGYNIVGFIPKLLEGSDVWVLYLTRELYLDSQFAKAGGKVDGRRKDKIGRRGAAGDEASDSGVLAGDRATA